MQFTKWNVWHSYSSSVVGAIPGLEKWAETAVQSRMSPLAIHRDGQCWYRARGQVQLAEAEIGFVPNRAEGRYTIPADAPDYAKECLLQAAAMRTHEQYALADALSRLPAYVRIYFEPSLLEFSGFSVLVYPQAKIYEDGVLLMQFRLLSGAEPYDVGPFVDEQVNLYAHQIVASELPQEIVLGAALHGFCYGRRRLWRSVSRLRSTLQGQLRLLVQTDEEGDFRARRIRVEGQVWETLASLDLAPHNLRALANLHVWSLLDAAAMAERRGIGLLRMPDRRRLGSYWSGRPSVYIAETEPHVTRSKDLLRDHADAVASVLLRSLGPFTREPTELIGPNLREFEDYALFANKGVTLWFGLNDKLFPPASLGGIEIDQDANLGGFVYTKHVQVELIEYWYIAHRVVEERSLEASRSLSALALMERRLAALDRSVEEIPPSGEIAELIRHVGACLNVAGISSQVRANLQYKEVLIQEIRDRRNLLFGTVLAVLLGLTGAPALAEALVQPLWEALAWDRPVSNTVWNLESFGIASLLLVGLVGIAAGLLYGFRKKR